MKSAASFTSDGPEGVATHLSDAGRAALEAALDQTELKIIEENAWRNSRLMAVAITIRSSRRPAA